MTIVQFLFYLAIGRLFIWLLQITGLLKPLWALHPLLEELRDCDLCLGFWVFLLLSIGLAPPFGWWHPIIEVILMAGISTMMVHLMKIGWISKFGVEIV